MTENKPLIIVSVSLTPEAKAQMDQACRTRGMSIKALLSRLVAWFVGLDRTEQAIVLGQIETKDLLGLSEMILRRGHGKPARPGHAAKAATQSRKSLPRRSVARSA